MKNFKEYSQLNLSEVNKKMLEYWSKHDVFHKSIETREGHPTFVFYEGPPSANGMPGIHHVMARTIKDVFCRYKTMQGFQVKRKAGWDTHGLPVELGDHQAARDIGRQQADDVERDDRDQAADDPGGDQELHRRDRHHLDGVDLLGDAHRAELRGEPAADRRRQRDAGDQRGDLAGVEVGRDEAGERGGAELVERGVAGQPDLGAGEEGHAEDDADGAADHGEGAGAEGDLGQDPQDLARVAHDRARQRQQHLDVEGQLVTEGVQALHGPVVDRLEVRHDCANPSSGGRSGGRSCSG